ncbi:MAG: endonuclease VII domain-containing protein [Nitrososphaerota archaeon]|nr:endonuclease VII domain-containing protein [Nitrososphaerota archaeon]
MLEHPALVKQYRRRHSLSQYWVDIKGRLMRLTDVRFQSILDAQGGACLICGAGIRGVDTKGWRLAMIDHDHAKELMTGKKVVRGLLCSSCNIELGHIEKEIVFMQKMLGYLLDRNTNPSETIVKNLRSFEAYASQYLAKYEMVGVR